MFVMHTVKYNEHEKELQGFEDGHCIEIVGYKDTEGRDWFKVYYDTQMLSILGRIGEADWYCRGLSAGLYDRPTGYEVTKLHMSLVLADNLIFSARGICFGHLFQVVYDDDSEMYMVAIDKDIVEDVDSFEEALAYCYGYAEGLDPNKPLNLKKGKGVIKI